MRTLETGFVVREGGIDEVGEGPWKKVGGRREKGVAYWEHRMACEDEDQQEGELH